MLLTKHEVTQAHAMAQMSANATTVDCYVLKQLRKHVADCGDPCKTCRKLNDTLYFLLEIQLGKN